MISQQHDIDKIYLYGKGPYKVKYKLLIRKLESTDLNYCEDSKAFTKYSNVMRDIYKNIEEYNPGKQRKILIVFDDMIADMISNKVFNAKVTELFIRGRKLNVSLVYIMQFCFFYRKTDYFITKILNKQELQQITFNHSLVTLEAL